MRFFRVLWRSDLLSVMRAGAGFHLVAEFAGLNRWYLHNSAASMVDMEAWAKRAKHTPKVEKKCGIRFCGQA